MHRIGWFSTGRDEAARQLLTTVMEAIQKGKIEAEIAFVFSNREPGEAQESDLFLELVGSYHVPLVCLSSQRVKADLGAEDWRREYERRVMQKLEAFPFDLGVLAGYMLIVGEEMCRRFNLVNLHPAAPGGPSGTWQEVVWKLMAGQARGSGVMMHLVTPQLDQGPPVTYCTYSLQGEPFDRYWLGIENGPWQELRSKHGEDHSLFRLVRQEGLKREFPLILATLKAFSQGMVKIEGGRVVDRQGRHIGPRGYDLTEEIERIVNLIDARLDR